MPLPYIKQPHFIKGDYKHNEKELKDYEERIIKQLRPFKILIPILLVSFAAFLIIFGLNLINL